MADVINISAIPGDGQVTLNWINPTNSDFSKVEVGWSSPEHAGSVIEFPGLPGESMSETITKLTNDVTYTFTFKTIDNNGNKQIEGRIIPVMLNDVFPPGDITELSVISAEREVSLNWINPPNTDFAKVRVSWSSPEHTGSIMEFPGLPEESVNETITGLDNDATYIFTFKTVDNNGNNQSEGIVIPVVIDDFLPPGDVTDIKAISSDTEIKLYWKNPLDADFSKVKVSWAPGDANSVMEFVGDPGEKMKKTITNLTNGTMYTFTIKSIDIKSNEQKTGKIISELPIAHWGSKNHIEYGTRWHPTYNYADQTGLLNNLDLDREVFDGISYVQLSSSWRNEEPTIEQTIERGFISPYLRQLINWVDAIHKKGLKIHLEIKNIPNWLGQNDLPDGGTGNQNCCNLHFSKIDHYRAYVRNIAKLFVGKVQSYSFASQVNIKQNWKGTIQEAMDAMVIGGRTIKTVYDHHGLPVSFSASEASPCWGCESPDGLIGSNNYEKILNMYDQFIGNTELMSLFGAVGISMNDHSAYGNMRLINDNPLYNEQPGTAPGWELIGVIRNKLNQADHHDKDIQTIGSWISWDDGIMRDVNFDGEKNEEDAVIKTIRIVGSFLSRGLNKINLPAVDFYNSNYHIGLVKQLDYNGIIENLKGSSWVDPNLEGDSKIINRSFEYRFNESTLGISLSGKKDHRDLYINRNNPNHPHYYIWKWYSQIASGKDEVVRHAMPYEQNNRLSVSGRAPNGWQFTISSYNVTQNSFIVLLYLDQENGMNDVTVSIPSKVQQGEVYHRNASPFVGMGFSNGESYKVEWETKDIITSTGRDSNKLSGISPAQIVTNGKLIFKILGIRVFTTLVFKKL